MTMLTEEEALSRISSSQNLLTRLNPEAAHVPPSNIVHKQLHPRRFRPKLTPEERLAIGVASILTSPTEAAREFGVSPQTASRLANGKTTHGAPDQDLRKGIESRLGATANVAIDKLVAALEHLTPDKMAQEKATGLARIANDMAGIVEKVVPKRQDEGNVQIHVYVPELREEREYDVIDVAARVEEDGRA